MKHAIGPNGRTECGAHPTKGSSTNYNKVDCFLCLEKIAEVAMSIYTAAKARLLILEATSEAKDRLEALGARKGRKV